MRVVIADDHEVVRIGVRVILEHSGEGYDVVGQAAGGGELLEVLARTTCDLVITDFLMPEEDEDAVAFDGINLLRELRNRYRALPVVVMTMARHSAIFRTMYQQGADAVVEKAHLVQELLPALRTVRSGRTYVSQHGVKQRTKDYAMPGRFEGDKPEPRLSSREAEVIRLFVEGRSITEIAALTGRSVKTISRQKRCAMEKLELSTNGQVFAYARAHGLDL